MLSVMSKNECQVAALQIRRIAAIYTSMRNNGIDGSAKNSNSRHLETQLSLHVLRQEKQPAFMGHCGSPLTLGTRSSRHLVLWGLSLLSPCHP